MKLKLETRKAFVEKAVAEYESQLSRLPFTKKTRGDLIAGYRDGFATALNGLALIPAEGWEE